jgi:DNA-binding response OmpR family regulator
MGKPCSIVYAHDGDIPDIEGEIEVFSTLLDMMLDVCGEIARGEEQVTVNVHPVPTGIDIVFRLAPGPAIQVIFRGTSDAADRKPAPEHLATLPDSFITFQLAQKIAVRHGMKIWLDIEPGEAQFNLYLHNYALMKTVERESPQVLIIEDVVPIGTLLEYYLTHAGFSALRAHHGDMGIELAHEHRPDMITLDLMMPEKDGWQVLDELKASDRTRDIPVVLVSVLKHRMVGYERGASDYLGKPVVREELVETARRLTRRHTVQPRRVPASPASLLYIGGTSDTDSTPDFGPNVRVRSVRGGDRFFITDILRDPDVPELILLDMALPREALAAVHRVRLADAFDAVPIVGVCSEELAIALRPRTRDIIDAFITREALTLSGLHRL